MTAMRKIKSWDEIPAFETEDDEREFWETHEISPILADDFDYPAKGPMVRRLHEVREVSPDLDDETVRRLIRLIIITQTNPKALISRLILNGLREEEQKIGLSNSR